MAKIINVNTGEEVTLLSQHVFGRHPNSSHTLLQSADTSRMHATIFWDGEAWLLQDSSSNGTYVNGVAVYKGFKSNVNEGDLVNFASLASDTWRVTDVSAPTSLLIPMTPGLPVMELTDLAVLPNEDTPESTLYMSTNGFWICESESGTAILKTGDLVGSQKHKWRFVEATGNEKTVQLAKQQDLSNLVSMRFDVSQNEEHVSVRFGVDNQLYDLGERNHHYLLLLLARKRLQDKQDGIADTEQGWIDKQVLSKMLGQNENHINIQIYRFRKQIVNTVPQTIALPQAIERRTREVRFAYDDIEIIGGIPTATNTV